MASTEKILANLKLIDSKKNSFQDAVLQLALGWKGLDEHLDSTAKCLLESLTELELREKNLDSVRQSAIEGNNEIDLILKSIELRAEELQCREEKFRSFQQEQIQDFKLKAKQLDTTRSSAEERIKEAELREERLSELQKSMEGLLENLEVEKQQFEHIQTSIGGKMNGVKSKEEYFEERSREIDAIQNWIERRAKELDTREEHVEECHKELELREKELDSAKKLNEEWTAKLDSRDKQLNSVQQYINKSFKDFHSKNKLLKLDEKLLEERGKELELKEKQLEERTTEFELKEKQFDNFTKSQAIVEQVEDMPDESESKRSAADNQFVVSMDGRGLQFLLNERVKDHESLSSEVCKALQLSMDPAKLVLEAMEGFYPPHLKKGDVEFDEAVVRRSCILLLEQLMRISPQIQPHVKEGALKLAGEWKVKMRVVPGNSLEVLGFLQLLASFKLASGFDTDELSKLFEVVAEHEQALELCQVLGLRDKVPDFIRSLIESQKYVWAIRYVYAFDLIDEFPPIPILKGHLTYAEEAAKKICEEGHNSLEAQNLAAKKEVAALKGTIDCIQLHGLESGYSPDSIKTCIEQLLKQKTDQRSDVSSPASKAQQLEEADCKSAMQSPATKALPQEEAHHRTDVQCLPSMSKTRKKNRKRRIAPVPDHASNTQHPQRHAKKLCQRAISGAVPDAPIDTARSFQSTILPYHHPPRIFTAETAPYRTESGFDFSEGSSPVPQYVSHLTSHGSHPPALPANGGIIRPFITARERYYLWSAPRQRIYDFSMH